MYTDALRPTPLTEEEYNDPRRTCTCHDESDPVSDPYGDNSTLPCMSPMNGMMGYPELHCNNCIYCQVVKSTNN